MFVKIKFIFQALRKPNNIKNAISEKTVINALIINSFYNQIIKHDNITPI